MIDVSSGLARIASGNGYLSYRDGGPEVVELGRLIEAAGVGPPLSGETYGWRMLDAVRDFKAKKGLPRSGRVDQEVLQALVREADGKQRSAAVDPAIRAALGDVSAPRAPRIDAPAPPGTVPAHTLINSGDTRIVGRSPPPGPTAASPRRLSLDELTDLAAKRAPIDMGARTPLATVAEPPRPPPRVEPSAPPPVPAPPPPSVHWPVPGHLSLNRADKPVEGEGEFGTLRSRGRTHKGIDIQAPVGARVEPFAPGKVIFSGTMEGFGQTVIVQHEGARQTVYAHLANRDVRVGQEVGPDTRLGTIGRSGNVPSRGDSHLHFELRVRATGGPLSGTPVDPLPLLRGVRR
jgi:murein DD-endopeptidase MepM/ murein hydrolase activator NlpD